MQFRRTAALNAIEEGTVLKVLVSLGEKSENVQSGMFSKSRSIFFEGIMPAYESGEISTKAKPSKGSGGVVEFHNFTDAN